MSSKVTFRAMERLFGPKQEGSLPESPLALWYESVRDRPVSEFTVEDLCRACRQQLFPEHVVPVALERLSQDPLAGEKYDGELIAGLTSIACGFWSNHPNLASDLASILSNVDPESCGDLYADVRQLLERLPR